MIRKYFTLKDLFDIVAPLKDYMYTGKVEEHAIKNITQAFYPSLTDTILDTAEANTLWCTYIVPRYYNMACFYVDLVNPESEFYEEEWRNWFRKFNSILVRNYEKYKLMIGYFNAAKNNLMDNIKSTSESKFNDTPQNVQGIYDWSDDDHLSNITRNETSTELGSKISRLKEIEDNITDHYDKWADEFGGLFIYE